MSDTRTQDPTTPDAPTGAPNRTGGVTPHPSLPDHLRAAHVDASTGLTKALSPRQAEVLGMADGGMTNAAIAEAIGIDGGTVSNAKVDGLHRAGRSGEVKGNGGRRGKAKAKVVGMKATVLDTLGTYLSDLREALSGEAEANTEAKGIGKAPWAKAQAKALEAEVVKAQAAVKVAQDRVAAFAKDPAPWVKEAEAKAKAKAEAAVSYAIDTVPAIVPEARQAVAYLGDDAPDDASAVLTQADAFLTTNAEAIAARAKAKAEAEAKAGA